MANANPHTNSSDVKQCKHCGIDFRRRVDGDRYYFKKRRFCSSSCATAGSAKHPPLSQRLAEHTNVAGPDDCWPWTGHRTQAGYGSFSFHGRAVYAHRAAYELYNAPLSKGLVVCHRCDNPSCVNPAHLFAGTQKENLHDMIRKGRTKLKPRRGMQHGCAKLSDAEAIAIRNASGKQRDIANQFGVSQATVSDIKLGKLWRHI